MTTFCNVNVVFVVVPNESIFNPLIKLYVSVVNVLCNCLGEVCVESLSVMTDKSENISNG